jgi:HTH-type transcriptional regulator, transcriptional repressor of NAD biosynthesis genes
MTGQFAPGSFSHGLIIGKFYPPHRGHQYLITQAAAACEHVTVLVMASRWETIPVSDRVGWLRAAHPGQGDGGGLGEVVVTGVTCDIPVDYGDASIWAAQVAVMRAALARDRRPAVDAVFSSEPYGAELAEWFGTAHVAVDPARVAVPVSASQIRADLAGNWEALIPPARAGLATRVVVLGAESTGTTTIAGLLAAHYRERGGAWARTPCVGEFGRDHTVIKWDAARAAARGRGEPDPALDEITWTREDFDIVAREQTRRENAAAASSGSPLVVCDTDAFATSVWERRYLGTADGGARDLQPWATDELPVHDLYLLTSHAGVPWRDDGLREGDLAVRAAMTDWFAAALTASGHSWVLLTGSLEERLRLAIRATELALRFRGSFGASMTQASGAEASRAYRG